MRWKRGVEENENCDNDADEDDDDNVFGEDEANDDKEIKAEIIKRN